MFPGSNCDRDAQYALSQIGKFTTDFVWHAEIDVRSYDLILLPGGFSYGDYLRTGAVARFARVMNSVHAAASRGVPIIGICNGFQILLEAGLLPGALLRNSRLSFHHEWINIRTERTDTIFSGSCANGQVLRMPIAHGEGNYYAEDDTIRELEENGQVLFRYCNKHGHITHEDNPNGSVNNIAGIMNTQGNILGMMPHPERASEALLGGSDGAHIWKSLMSHLKSASIA